MPTDVKIDEYNEVTNHNDTFDGLAERLTANSSVIFGWTDEQGTHLDILMCYHPEQLGSLQGGMSAPSDLFVAVARVGMFGFALNGSWKSPGYVAEKLGFGRPDTSTAELSELINGVCRRLEAVR